MAVNNYYQSNYYQANHYASKFYRVVGEVIDAAVAHIARIVQAGTMMWRN